MDGIGRGRPHFKGSAEVYGQDGKAAGIAGEIHASDQIIEKRESCASRSGSIPILTLTFDSDLP